jgi:dipeptidyl aminopeptidase/acylaminoacyl peptidase
MSSTPMRWPQGNIWYLYGSRFLGWISDVYGPDTMRAVSIDYGSSVAPWGINRAMRRATGRTYEELYEGWKDNLKRRYGEQMRAVEARGLREGKRLTHHGRNVYYPRFVPKNALSGTADEVVYYRNDFNARSGLYRLALTPARDAAADKPTLFARTAGTTTASFSPEGDLYFSSSTPWKIVYNRDDIYRVSRGKTAGRGDEPWRSRLTEGMRASGADVSPDGRHISFIVNTKGTTYLEIADLTPTGTIENRRDLVPSARFEQAYTPRFSPDGRSLAYSAWTAGGYRDVRIVDVRTGSFVQVTRDRALDANPVWSPDGKTLLFTSDRSGISNVYAYDVANKTLKQVTNVRTGAFQPAVSPDGKTLVYVGYTSLGFDLYAMPLDPARFLDAPPAPTDRPDPPTEPERIAIKRGPYRSITTLAPRSYSLEYGPGSYSLNAITISAQGADVAGFHSVGASLTADFAAPAPRLSLSYAYRRLPVDLGLRFFSTVAPRTGYRIGDREVAYDELALGMTSSLSYQIPGEFTNQSVGLSYSITSFRGDLPVPKASLDPFATITIKPPQGMLGIVHLGYGFSNVEGSLDAAGAIRGFSMRLGVDYASPATGSDYTLQAFEGSITGYVPMPWPGLHTLGVRVAGGMTGGNYPRGGYYFVGGYDVESYSIVDTITTGVYDGAFVLRGYNPRSIAGRAYVLQNLEYRFPILKPDRGLSTLPLYMRRIDGNVFLDYGGAFDKLALDEISLFSKGAIINSPQLHTSAGFELWTTLTLGYYLTAQLRVGYAYGFSSKAIPGGQLYFVAGSAF